MCAGVQPHAMPNRLLLLLLLPLPLSQFEDAGRWGKASPPGVCHVPRHEGLDAGQWDKCLPPRRERRPARERILPGVKSRQKVCAWQSHAATVN